MDVPVVSKVSNVRTVYVHEAASKRSLSTALSGMVAHVVAVFESTKSSFFNFS